MQCFDQEAAWQRPRAGAFPSTSSARSLYEGSTSYPAQVAVFFLLSCVCSFSFYRHPGPWSPLLIDLAAQHACVVAALPTRVQSASTGAEQQGSQPGLSFVLSKAPASARHRSRYPAAKS